MNQSRSLPSPLSTVNHVKHCSIRNPVPASGPKSLSMFIVDDSKISDLIILGTEIQSPLQEMKGDNNPCPCPSSLTPSPASAEAEAGFLMVWGAVAVVFFFMLMLNCVSLLLNKCPISKLSCSKTHRKKPFPISRRRRFANYAEILRWKMIATKTE